MRETLRVKYYLYINNMSIVIMNGINDIGRKSPFIANKIVSIGGKIKLSISNLSIKVGNTINEFIHPGYYENKIIFNVMNTFFKSKDLTISNKGINNETIEFNRIDDEKNTLQERLEILKDIELPNGDLIPIDDAINDLYLCKQDSPLKSKLSLIDYITEIQFKSSTKTKIELLNKSNDNLNISNLKGEVEGGYEYVDSGDYISKKTAIIDPQYDQVNDDDLVNTDFKNIDKNTSNEVNSNINENQVSVEKENFKSHLIEITKDISLLDRLSDDNDRYGYVFLAKVVNYLEDYNKNKEQEKTDYFNKENYLKKLANSDYFFKLNKKVNNVIYLQYLKKEQNSDENGVVEKIIITANNTQDEDSNSLGVDKPIESGFFNAMRKAKSDEIKESIINDIISSLEEIPTLDKEKITELKNKLSFNSKRILFSGDATSLAKIKNDFADLILDTILNSDDKIKSNIGNINSYKYFLQDSINNAVDIILYKN